jgi:uncharacterized membrane protein
MSGSNSKDVRKLTALVQQQARAIEELRNSPLNQQLEISQSAFSGPVPSPEMVEHYNAICPGLGNELVKSYIEEKTFRRGLESRDLDEFYKGLKEDQKQSRLGLVLGFVVIMTLIGFALYAMHLGHVQLAGGIVGTLIGIATVFLGVGANRKYQAWQQQQKKEESQQDNTLEQLN